MENREIKFRIWNPAGNKMLYDVENVFECLMQQIRFDKTMPTRFQNPSYDHRSEGMVWMQYTGLTDRNGKYIYEGDVVVSTSSTGQLSTKDYGYGFKICTGEKFIVSYLVCGLVLRHISSYGNSMFETPNCVINDWAIVESYEIWNNSKGLEIVGNIYENPELLK